MVFMSASPRPSANTVFQSPAMWSSSVPDICTTVSPPVRALWAFSQRLANAWERMMCIQSGRRISRFVEDSPMVETNLEYIALMYSTVSVSSVAMAVARASARVRRSFSSSPSVLPDT